MKMLFGFLFLIGISTAPAWAQTQELDLSCPALLEEGEDFFRLRLSKKCEMQKKLEDLLGYKGGRQGNSWLYFEKEGRGSAYAQGSDGGKMYRLRVELGRPKGPLENKGAFVYAAFRKVRVLPGSEGVAPYRGTLVLPLDDNSFKVYYFGFGFRPF